VLFRVCKGLAKLPAPQLAPCRGALRRERSLTERTARPRAAAGRKPVLQRMGLNSALSVMPFARQREQSHTENPRAAKRPATPPRCPAPGAAPLRARRSLPAEPARRLEERGLAVTASALRVAYAAGGDGGTDLRLDLRNAAAFVRDPDALVTCLLLPLSASARMEAQARAPPALGRERAHDRGARGTPRARGRTRPAPPRPRHGGAGAPGGRDGAASAPASMPGCCLRRAAEALAGSLVRIGMLPNAA